MSPTLLDSSAVLAVLFGEPGRDRVAASIREAQISSVNMVEAISKLIDEGHDEYVAESIFRGLMLRVRDFSAGTAGIAARMRATTSTPRPVVGRPCLSSRSRRDRPSGDDRRPRLGRSGYRRRDSGDPLR